MTWKELLKQTKEISKDKKTKVSVRKQVKRVLKNRKEFLKFYLRYMGIADDLRKDIFKAVKLKLENDNKSILNNPQISKKKQEELIKGNEKYMKKNIRELKEIIKWSER